MLPRGGSWWHGGPRFAGDLILPADDTGARALKSDAPAMDAAHVRTDRVYLTDTPMLALLYCVSYGTRSYLYEVEPDGPLEPDPDYHGDQPTESVMAPQARIVRRLQPSRRQLDAAQAVLLGMANLSGLRR